MDEKRTTDTGMGEEGETSKEGQPGGSYQPGQGGQGGTQDSGQGIQPGRGDSQGNDWDKEPDKGTPESES